MSTTSPGGLPYVAIAKGAAVVTMFRGHAIHYMEGWSNHEDYEYDYDELPDLDKLPDLLMKRGDGIDVLVPDLIGDDSNDDIPDLEVRSRVDSDDDVPVDSDDDVPDLAAFIDGRWKVVS